MHFKNILEWSYWFYEPFIAVGTVKWVWIIGFLSLVFVGLLSKIVRILNKKLSNGSREVLRRAGNWLIVSGLLGLLWMFFRQEKVAFLAWRFWLIFWLILFVVWGYKIFFYALKRLPAINAEQSKRELKNKYLPKK